MAKKLTIAATKPGEGTYTRRWVTQTPGEEYTEKRLREVTHRLRLMYAQAYSDLANKQSTFVLKHEKRVAKYQAEVDAGLLSKKDFQAWMRGQLFQEEAWRLKRGQLARMMVDVDQQAMRLVRDGALDVFSENANFMTFKIEKGSSLTTTFGLFNTDAIARLLLDEPDLLPRPEIDADKDFAWYNRVISNAVMHGILQGESLDDIALRVAEETGEKGFDAILRNARTAYTGAQNAGEQHAMRRCRDDLGIKIQKRWAATLDASTRDAHAALDGQVRDIDQPFDSMLGPIMYPGDPGAEPANVYNCRCSMDEYFPDYDNRFDRLDSEGNAVGDMTYEEWRAWKTEQEG